MRFGDEFKAAEAYAGLKVEPLYVARLDGWAFHTFTKKMGYEKPYDRRLTGAFIQTIVENFFLRVGEQAAFDSRIIPVKSVDEVISYLSWRQTECRRNFVNGYAEHLLRESGLSPAVAAKRLRGMNGIQLKEFCKEKSLDLEADIFATQRQGLLFYYENFTKDAFNPMTKQPVKAQRRRVTMMTAPPTFDSEAMGEFLQLTMAPEMERQIK